MANPVPMPEMTPLTKLSQDWKERARAYPGSLPAGTVLLPFDDRDWCAAEQYRMVRTKIVQQTRHSRLLAITSAQVQDGKSVTAVNLAAALALKGESSVLLVDADLRRPSAAQLLNVPNSPGLSEILRKSCTLEEAVVRVELTPGLYVLPAGEVNGNPAELFDSDTWSLLSQQMRMAFQWVIIDTTPVGVVADYELVQAVVDGVVLVARPDHTNRDRFFNALRLVSNEKLLGVICNCVPEWFASKHSSHDYKHYYRTDHD